MRCKKLLPALLLLLAFLALPAVAQTSLPPTPPVKLAVNPLTGKLYMANTDANTVTAFDPATNASTVVPVGNAPSFVAVNPVTNRVYVDNSRDATLSVIDGDTDTLLATYGIGSSGPIAVNPLTNVVYVVRLTGTVSDEVTFFNGDTNTWYTIATNSFQPNAMAVDPVTDTIYVTHYGTGDVRVIGGAFDPANDFPASTSIGTGPHPYAIAVNPVTDKVYVITQDTSNPILAIDGADNSVTLPAVASGHALDPQSIAVNPVSNKAYAAFSNEVIVIDGATDALTYVPISGASSGAIALGIDYATNRIYAAAASGTLSVIDGDTDTVIATQSIPTGTSSVAVNPLTGKAYFFDTTLAALAGTGAPHAIALTTSIAPLPGDTSPPDGSITLSASSAFSPSALPVRGVYYRLDTRDGRWSLASGSGPYTASFSGLAPGPHTLYAFAADGQDAPLATGPQSIPLLGEVASYTFTVPSLKVDPSVSLASSANPSVAGESVTFTASVTGSQGTPTGSVTFLDGTTALCAQAALAGGAATCSNASLAAGAHSITAQYSGDSKYNAATTGALSQRVDAPKAAAAASLSSSPNPSTAGQGVTFTVAVTGSSGTPTGTVDFLDGSSAISGCSAISLSAGAASCSTSSLSAGGHSISAHYSGDATYDAATSNTVTQTVQSVDTDPPRLGNLSTRGDVLSGADVMIGGFVISGSVPKTIVVRAIGPSLAQYGIGNALSNPTLRLVRSSDQSTVATNDDWGTNANASDISASGFAPSDPRESALLVTLPPGAYTAIVSGVGGATGVGLTEVYEIDHPEVPLINISTRGHVGSGTDVMIGGFVVTGSAARKVVVRGIGPSLANYGIPSPLANPKLQLVRMSDGATIAVNDDWGSAPNAGDISASGFAPSDPRESAIMVTLDPGAYTAIVTGSDGGSGTGMVETYLAP